MDWEKIWFLFLVMLISVLCIFLGCASYYLVTSANIQKQNNATLYIDNIPI